MLAGRWGGEKSILAQLLADILDMPVVTHKGGETGGALGAARLACLAAGKPLAAVCENLKSSKPGAAILNVIMR